MMKNHIIPLAKELMSIHSTKENTAELHHVLQTALHATNKTLTVEKFEKDGIKSALIHNRPVGTKHFRIILNAHLDVVPASATAFQPKEVNGKLYGRGSYDMKAAAAVMIVLLNNLADKLSYPIALQLVTDEEYSGEYGAGFQLQQGITADFALTGECGSNLHIKHKAKGHMAVKLTAKGIPSHGAYPWLGENAIMYMHEVINSIKNLYPQPSGALWGTLVSVTRIESSNQTHNKIPADCTAYLDVRFIPEDKEKVIEKIRQHLPEQVSMEIPWVVSSHYTDPAHDDLLALRDATKEIIGHIPNIQEAQAASDMRLFTEAGIPSVEFGPVGDKHHADNEWVDLQGLEDYYLILEHFLKKI